MVHYTNTDNPIDFPNGYKYNPIDSKCPDGLLPDGESCPNCGHLRGPSGVDGGSWVHLTPELEARVLQNREAEKHVSYQLALREVEGYEKLLNINKQIMYKIRRVSDSLYCNPSIWSRWDKNGKVWNSYGNLCRHIAYNKNRYEDYRHDYEVIHMECKEIKIEHVQDVLTAMKQRKEKREVSKEEKKAIYDYNNAQVAFDKAVKALTEAEDKVVKFKWLNTVK